MPTELENQKQDQSQLPTDLTQNTTPSSEGTTPENLQQPLENPSSDNKEESKAPEASVAAPIEPEPYEIEVDENSPLTQEELEAIAEYAGRMGLSKDEAQKMIVAQESLYKRGQETIQKAQTERIETMKREMYSHPDFQEGRKEATWMSINRAVQTFGNEKLVAALSDPTSHGYNLDLALFLKNIGDALGPEVLPGAGTPSSSAGNKSFQETEEERYKRIYPGFYDDKK